MPLCHLWFRRSDPRTNKTKKVREIKEDGTCPRSTERRRDERVKQKRKRLCNVSAENGAFSNSLSPLYFMVIEG